MADIERFTKQKIEVQVVEGFAPEPGERAEPIAMGRQTIWGGAGKPPSRDVMQAAAKAARTEMMQRVRDNKPAQGDRGGNGGGARKPGGGGGNPPRSRSGGQPSGQGPRQPQGQGQGQGRSGNAGERQPSQRAPQGQPDPMRTSVDMMAERGRRGGGSGFGGGGNRNRTGGGGGAGGRGNGQGRSGGGGYGSGSFGR
jgi:ATP-dependent RNA helicase RhlE